MILQKLAMEWSKKLLNDLIDFSPTSFLEIKKYLIKTNNLNLSNNYIYISELNLQSMKNLSLSESTETNKLSPLCLKINWLLCFVYIFVGYTLNGRSVLVSCWVLVPSSRELKRQWHRMRENILSVYPCSKILFKDMWIWASFNIFIRAVNRIKVHSK